MVPVGTRLMLLFCVLYELRDSNYRLTYCKLGQFLFRCCSLLFLSGRNLFVFLRIVFNSVLFVCYCYSVLWLQISNKYLLTYHLITVQPPRNTHFSSLVTLARSPTSSSLRITDHSFQYASTCLWNQLPHSLFRPHSTSLW